MAQLKDGSTVNASVSVNGAGTTTYGFSSPFDMSVNLGSVSSVLVTGTAFDDNFYLASSDSNVINGGAGNNVYFTNKSASDLNSNILRGGSGVDIVKIGGSSQEIDLTQGSSGIEAVVGSKSVTGETVDLKLSQLSSSALTGGNGGTGKAFVALIGHDGIVNVTESGKFKLIGEVDAAGDGFAPDGTALNTADSAALAARETSISGVQGTLAQLYDGSASTAKLSATANSLNAYIFSDGTTSYTVWTDGTVQPIDSKGDTLAAAFQPITAQNPTAVLGTVSLYDPTSGASAKLSTTPNGTGLSIGDGQSGAYAAVVVGPVSNSQIHGDKGANGGDWFSLAKSGGGNTVTGSSADDVFDLGSSTGLVDQLAGGAGFDTVIASADGADVDLTNATVGKASSGIDAVVGGAKTSQTVEVNLSSLSASTDANGLKTASFEALLGSSADTLTLSGNGAWREVAMIAPGATLPANATALNDAATLDTLFHATKSHTAENSLVGYLFEQDGKSGSAIEYATVWTDATVAAVARVTLLGQAIAQTGASIGSATTTSDSNHIDSPSTLLAAAVAHHA